MPTYWLSSPYTFAADSSLHAGQTVRTWLGNMQCVVENSGYNYDVTIRDLPLASTISVAATWDWVPEISPFPIPVWRKQGGGWREYTFDIMAESDGNQIDVRIFLLSQKAHPLIDSATGDVEVPGGITTAYADYSITAFGRYDQEIKLAAVDAETVLSRTVDQAWVHVAAYSAVLAGFADDLTIYAMNIKESA